MASSLSLQALVHTSRAQVYLLWAILVAVGFTATHYYQDPNINIVWTALSIVGLGFMYRVMPLGVTQMKRIYLSWLVPILVGIAVSVVAARTDIIPYLIGYLGVFWLIIMAIGFIWNGLVDRPATWYFVAALLHILAAIICLYDQDFLRIQYLVAAVVCTWSMLNLWIFRSEL